MAMGICVNTAVEEKVVVAVVTGFVPEGKVVVVMMTGIVLVEKVEAAVLVHVGKRAIVEMGLKNCMCMYA